MKLYLPIFETLLLFLFMLFSIFGVFRAVDGTTWRFNAANVSWDTPSSDEVVLMKDDMPIVLWWTQNLYPHTSNFLVRKCPASSCYVTNEKRFLDHNQTKVIYFYGTEFDSSSLPLPRKTSHLWALAHEESPLNNFILSHAVGMNLFNYTATYHRASDFPITLLSFPGPEFILTRNPVPTSLKNKYQTTKGLAPVVYVQSHCEVPSDRDRYVQNLMEYIKIDSYGKCLHNKDLPKDLDQPVEKMFDKDFKHLLSQYKFILAFENGICDDYMTEKLFRPLHVGSVPVYKGSPRAKDYMPDNHSMILVDDFDSPKTLANFLHKLNGDDEEYEKYLEFKKTKKITNPYLKKMIDTRPWPFTNMDTDYGLFFDDFECFLCDKATERRRNERAHSLDKGVPLMEPKLTDGRKFACPAPEPVWEPEKLDWWFLYDFTEQYWKGLDHARAARDMIQAGERNSTAFPFYLAKYTTKSKKNV